MKVLLRRIGLILGSLFLLLGIAVALAYLTSNPRQPGADSNSTVWLQTGPFSVAEAERTFVDNTRPTPSNNDYPGAPSRTLVTTLWYPLDVPGNHPLIIHSHGFVSTRGDTAYLNRTLASWGYVVAAADYPLTNGAAPGGPNAGDVVNQPGDISFLIDSVLSLDNNDKPFSGDIDRQRIGLTGYSLGGLTTALATFHPRQRDERISAALAIAAPIGALDRLFFQTADTPYLAINGTADALIDYSAHGVIVPQRIPSGELLTIAGGAHLGFVGMAEPLFRFMHNPDTLGCSAVLSGLGDSSVNDIYVLLGSADEGVIPASAIPEVCQFMPPQEALHPGRQQMITRVATLSFFESHFSGDLNRRRDAREQLRTFTSADFPEASFN